MPVRIGRFARRACAAIGERPVGRVSDPAEGKAAVDIASDSASSTLGRVGDPAYGRIRAQARRAMRASNDNRFDIRFEY